MHDETLKSNRNMDRSCLMAMLFNDVFVKIFLAPSERGIETNYNIKM
mgnify:CR=1 FL=1